MRWDLVSEENPELIWIKQLIALRKENRALRIGNFRLIESERLLAFERYTNRALETVTVLANPSDAAVTERVMVANASLMDSRVPSLRCGNPALYPQQAGGTSVSGEVRRMR